MPPTACQRFPIWGNVKAIHRMGGIHDPPHDLPILASHPKHTARLSPAGPHNVACRLELARVELGVADIRRQSLGGQLPAGPVVEQLQLVAFLTGGGEDQRLPHVQPVARHLGPVQHPCRLACAAIVHLAGRDALEGGEVPLCVTLRRVAVSLRGPGQSPVLPFACCVGSLRCVGCCGLCSCCCRFRVRGAQSLVHRGCAGCSACRLCVSGA